MPQTSVYLVKNKKIIFHLISFFGPNSNRTPLLLVQISGSAPAGGFLQRDDNLYGRHLGSFRRITFYSLVRFMINSIFTSAHSNGFMIKNQSQAGVLSKGDIPRVSFSDCIDPSNG